MPRKSELEEEGLGGNRDYEYFGGVDWRIARECLDLERRLMTALRGTRDGEVAKHRFLLAEILREDSHGLDDDAISDAVYDRQIEFSASESMIYALDSGCAAAVCALYAAACAPVTSCNGGSFGGYHQYAEPTIVFYANRRNVNLLNAAAGRARLLLSPGSQGIPILVARRPEKFTNFAEALLDLHRVIEPVRNRRKTTDAPAKR